MFTLESNPPISKQDLSTKSSHRGRGQKGRGQANEAQAIEAEAVEPANRDLPHKDLARAPGEATGRMCIK